MRIGKYYKSTKTGLILQGRTYSVVIDLVDKEKARIRVEEVYKVYKENAFSYVHPIEVEVPLRDADALSQKLTRLVELYLEMNLSKPSSSPAMPSAVARITDD